VKIFPKTNPLKQQFGSDPMYKILWMPFPLETPFDLEISPG